MEAGTSSPPAPFQSGPGPAASPRHPSRPPRLSRLCAPRQVDIATDYQDIVSSLVRKQVPKIQESELLRLRESEAADTATAKELIVDGAAYKVAPAPRLTPAPLLSREVS